MEVDLKFFVDDLKPDSKNKHLSTITGADLLEEPYKVLKQFGGGVYYNSYGGYQALLPEEARDVKEAFGYKVGDDIYVKTHLHISHGADDVIGGKAKIERITYNPRGGLPINHYMIEVEEHPGCAYNLQILLDEQEKLKFEFGDKRAYADPDNRPSMNTGW